MQIDCLKMGTLTELYIFGYTVRYIQFILYSIYFTVYNIHPALPEPITRTSATDRYLGFNRIRPVREKRGGMPSRLARMLAVWSWCVNKRGMSIADSKMQSPSAAIIPNELERAHFVW